MAWTRLSTAAQNAANNAIVDLVDAGPGSGLIQIYTGTAPASPDTAVSTQTLLVTLTYADPAYTTSASGTANTNTITQGTAVAAGTAAWARHTDSAGNPVFDCDVGVTSGALTLNTVLIEIGTVVRVTSGTATHPAEEVW